MVKVQRYSAQMAKQWDEFVRTSKCPTLLHLRPYMDYHADRFQDVSLVLTDERDRLVGVLPACLSRGDGQMVVSHEGLTYGGFIFAPYAHTSLMAEGMESALDYYRTTLGATAMTVRPIPYIYNTQPCDEQLYLLHRLGARLVERDLSQAINLTTPLRWSELRRRGVVRAHRHELTFAVTEKREEWEEFHKIVCAVLSEHHGTQPVHSAAELWLLHSRFPDHILLFTARRGATLVAGTVVYLSPTVAHTQYLAASSEGRETGGLDFVISRALEMEEIRKRQWLDFGVSTERDGRLNLGLTMQKEGFGARGVCYDTYTLTL